MFLFYLHSHANTGVLEEERAHALLVLWLSSRLTELFLSQAICKTQPLPKEMLSNWADSARPALEELYVLHAALAAISQQYFSGHDMLWPASREALGLRITVAEGMCERGKGLLETCGKPSKFVRRLDPESI